jgi:hypothetical protein
MRVDPVIPHCEKCTLVIEAIGGDKVGVNHQSLDTPFVIARKSGFRDRRRGQIAPHRAGATVGRVHRRGADRAGGLRLPSGNQIDGNVTA